MHATLLTSTAGTGQHQAPRKFAGTRNPRELRALDALLNAAAVSRHDLDNIIGAANGPEVISRLRAKGLCIPCTLIDFTDRDGNKCRPGEYHLTDDDRSAVTAWMKSEVE
ncbi:hypothetical protein [Simplicispira psychrophila]|uniref:hypothetical protein n=1 Tax=Simplicispira psychrophila TaxID=80882 RepID=UPI0004851AD7|nr:hypothetical protein [Simplicispira psychrophila]